MRKNNKFRMLPKTPIEMFAFKGDQVFKKTIEFQEIKNVKRISGWRYDFYQVGFCTIKPTN